MMELVFATNNKHKLKEIAALVNEKYCILSLSDIQCFAEIPETGSTLRSNAAEKASFVYNSYHKNCFADDTGLEIEALNGQPGVYSARYAGEGKSFEDNMNKVLHELTGQSNRKACFKTVIALILNGKTTYFEGKINGVILENKRGLKGFGYDPIFLPEGSNLSFAEMTLEEKNKISHRAMAFQQLTNYLNAL